MLLPNELENSSSSPVVSFSVNDSPIYIECVNLKIKNHTASSVALLIVLTNRGSLYLYVNELTQSNMNETKSSKKSATSVKSFRQLVIETKENVTLKISAAYLSNSKNERVESSIELDSVPVTSNDSDFASNVFKNLASHCGLFLVYGSNMNLRMEKLVSLRRIRSENLAKNILNL